MPILLLPVFAFILWLLWGKELRFQWRKFRCYRSGHVLPSHPLTAVVLNTQHGEPRIWAYPGILVRSRSEKVIAEYLARAGVEFEYEAPVERGGGYHYFPDFTLRVGSKTFYLEHFGLMSDADYVAKAKRKVEWFNANHPGRLLVCTARMRDLKPALRRLLTDAHKTLKTPSPRDTGGRKGPARNALRLTQEHLDQATWPRERPPSYHARPTRLVPCCHLGNEARIARVAFDFLNVGACCSTFSRRA